MIELFIYLGSGSVCNEGRKFWKKIEVMKTCSVISSRMSDGSAFIYLPTERSHSIIV
jgi:hypothetical protein